MAGITSIFPRGIFQSGFIWHAALNLQWEISHPHAVSLPLLVVAVNFWWFLLFADALLLSPRGLLFLPDGLLVRPGGLLSLPSGLLLILGGLLFLPGGLL